MTIDFEDVPVSKYNTRPHQADQWFKAFHKAISMCGGSSDSRRVISKREIEYLDALVRGAYAKRELPAGYVFDKETFDKDFYLAIPLKKGQLSCREVMNGEKLTKPLQPNEALTVDVIDGPYAENPSLKQLILNRGA